MAEPQSSLFTLVRPRPTPPTVPAAGRSSLFSLAPSVQRRGTYFSGGPISDVFDVLRTGEFAIGGLLAGKGVRRGIRERTESAPEFKRLMLQAGAPDTFATKAGAFVASLVVDPLNLVGTGLVGKGLRVVGLGAGAARAGRVVSAVTGRVGAAVTEAAAQRLPVVERALRVRAAGRALEPILERQAIEEAQGIERSVDLAKAIRRDALTLTRNGRNARRLDQALGGYFDAGADTMMQRIAQSQKTEVIRAVSGFSQSVQNLHVHPGRELTVASDMAVKSYLRQLRVSTERYAPEFLDEVDDIIARIAHGGDLGPALYESEIVLGRLHLKSGAGTRVSNLAGARRAAREAQQAFADSLPADVRGFVEKWAPIAMAQDADLAQHLVRVGMMTPETAAKWAGMHLRRIYQKFEDPQAFVEFLERADPAEAARLLGRMERGIPIRRVGQPIPTGVTKARELIPAGRRAMLGEIEQASSRIAVGGTLASRAIARGDAYAKVAQQFGIDDVIIRSHPMADKFFRQMPETTGWGQLAGKWLPKEIADPLLRMVKQPEGLDKFLQTTTGWFKFAKVILNPSTHFRNMRTNLALAHNAAGLGALNPVIWGRAIKEVLTNGQAFREAKGVSSAFIDTFTQTELRNFVGDATQNGLIGFFRKTGAALGRAYQMEEQVGKMAVYLTAKGRGLSSEASAKLAELALFNYRKVPHTVDRMRRLGIYPFLTFPYKVATETLPLALKRPSRFAQQAKIIQGVGDSLTPEEERVLPAWMRGGGWLKLPFTVNGHPILFDLTYELPWGDIGETGTPASAVVNLVNRVRAGEPLDDALRSLSPFLTPVGQTAAEMILNRQAFQGREVYTPQAPPGQQAREAGQHLLRFATPGIIAKTVLPGGELRRAIERRPTPGGTPPLPVPQAAVSALFGLKTRPLDVEREQRFRKFERSRGLRDVEEQIRRVKGNRAISDAERQRRVAELLDRRRLLRRRYLETGTVELP